MTWNFMVARFVASMLAALLPCSAADPAPGQQGVLVVYSDARVQPGLVIIDESIRSTLSQRSSLQLAYFNEFIDATRFPDKAHQERFADYLAEKYRDTRIDAVVCVRDTAFTFMIYHRASIAPQAPVVHLMVSPGLVAAAEPADLITGVVMDPDTAPLLALVRRLHPHGEIVVVGGSSELDQQWLASFRRELAGQPVRWLVGLPLEQVLAEVAVLPKHCVIVNSYYGSDSSGRAYIPVEAKRRICQASSVPCYGSYSVSIGEGPVGGGGVRPRTRRSGRGQCGPAAARRRAAAGRASDSGASRHGDDRLAPTPALGHPRSGAAAGKPGAVP